MASAISHTFRNPSWRDIAAKDAVVCEMVETLDNGQTMVYEAVINKGVEGENPDWEMIMEKFGEEAITEATTEQIQKRNTRREEDRQRRIEDDKRKLEFEKQEALFASKLEAFEIEAVKNSKNRTLKAKIRKSKSIMEVQAYTTILIMKELEIAEQEAPAAAKE